MTTIHSHTGDQPTLDTLHRDLARGGAAALSSIRPISLVDFKIVAKRATAIAEINAAMLRAAEQELKGVLAGTAPPNVSSDFNHDPPSATSP